MLHHVLVSDKPREWGEKLPYLLSAYNETPHSTTGLSPYHLIFGHVARGILSVLRDTWEGTMDKPPSLNKTTVEYLNTLKQNLKVANDLACDITTKMQKVYVDNHNKHSKAKSFSVNDDVLILMSDDSNQLLSRWIPAVVVNKFFDNSYQVSCENGAMRTLHADKLRLFNNRVSSVGIIFDDDDDDS
jgi:hypothetical protein